MTDIGVGASLVEPLTGDPAAATAQHAELRQAQQSELRIAILVALIGLGVGIGCSMAGQISGNRLELGLVPVGGFSLVVMTLVLAGVVGKRDGDHRLADRDWRVGGSVHRADVYAACSTARRRRAREAWWPRATS